MGKKIYIILLSIVVLIIGIVIFNKGDDKNHSFTKGVSVFKSKISSVAKNDKKIKETKKVEPVKKVDGCKVALEFLDQDNKCIKKDIKFNGKTVNLVYMQGAEKENAIVMADERVIVIPTNLYFKPFEAIKEYVKNKNSIDLTDDDLKNTSEKLVIGKRGYLYSLTFSGDYKGSLYITPQGRVSGKLSK